MEQEQEVETPEVEAEAPAPEQKEDSQARNWENARRVMAEQQEKIQKLESLVGSMGSSKSEEEISEDDIMTYGQYKKLEQKRLKQLEAQSVQTAEQIFAARNPDYNELINTYLPKMIEKNPGLRESLGNNPRAHEIAYNLIKESAMYQKDQGVKTSPEAKKILKNASQPVSGSAVAKGPVKNSAYNYDQMSNSEIIALAKARARGQSS